MLDRVLAFCKQHNLFELNNLEEGQKKLIVACSGGPDSLALLDIMVKLREKLQLRRLVAAHYEHGIRGAEALADAEYVAEFCTKRGIECYIEHGDVPAAAKLHGKSIETMAREMRYDFLHRVSKKLGGALIATAHHRNDQAETVMMHIIRGTGSQGLVGIEPRRGLIVRPLLFAEKKELIDYCVAYGFTARHDSTNDVPDCLRNRIRLELMPLLEREYNPAFVDALCNLSQLSRDDNDFINSALNSAWLENITVTAQHEFSVDCSWLTAAPRAISTRLLRRMVGECYDFLHTEKNVSNVSSSDGSFGFSHVQRLLEFARSNRTGSKLSLPGSIGAAISYRKLIIAPEDRLENCIADVYAAYNHIVKNANIVIGILSSVGNNDVIVPEEGIISSFYEADNGVQYELRLSVINEGVEVSRGYGRTWLMLSYDSLKRSIEKGQRFFWRFRQSGDRLKLKAGHKKLKDFFIDRKLPQELRGKIPLLCCGDDILWVLGMHHTEAYQPDIEKNTCDGYTQYKVQEKYIKIELREKDEVL